MTTIEPREKIIPGPAPSPEAASPDSPGQPVEARRRTTRLDADYYASRRRRPPSRPAPPAVPAPEPRRTWLRLAERVLGDWAPTLRASLALAAAFLALAVVLVLTFGYGGALLALGLGITLWRLLHDY